MSGAAGGAALGLGVPLIGGLLGRALGGDPTAALRRQARRQAAAGSRRGAQIAAARGLSGGTAGAFQEQSAREARAGTDQLIAQAELQRAGQIQQGIGQALSGGLAGALGGPQAALGLGISPNSVLGQQIGSGAAGLTLQGVLAKLQSGQPLTPQEQALARFLMEQQQPGFQGPIQGGG